METGGCGLARVSLQPHHTNPAAFLAPCLDSGETLGFGLWHAEEGGEEQVPNLSPSWGIHPVLSHGPSFFFRASKPFYN